LEKCEIPERIADQTHYVDMFPDWDRGLDELVASITTDWTRRHRPDKAA
jgi:hypothetical protein